MDPRVAMDETPRKAKKNPKRKPKRKRKEPQSDTKRIQKTARSFPSPFDKIVGRLHLQTNELCDDPESEAFDEGQYTTSQNCILMQNSYMTRMSTDGDVDLGNDFRRNRAFLSKDAAKCRELYETQMNAVAARILGREDYAINTDERIRAPIADTYTYWQAKDHEALREPSLDTDSCLLFDNKTRKSLEKEQPFRDFREFIGTIGVAQRHGDIELSRLTEFRVGSIEDMGFMRGLRCGKPDPRFRTRFLIMTGKYRPFGLYLFSNSEDMLVYFMYVAENSIL